MNFSLTESATAGWNGTFPQGERRHACAVVYRNVMVPMRDGVRLAADVYFPSDDGVGPVGGQRPVLLVRTPYSKRPAVDALVNDQDIAIRAALAGFGVVVQDSRGRYASEGQFRSMQDDGPDGWDTLVWLGQQPWCNGRVGMYGVSYRGAAQMMLAPMRPPHLAAAFSEQPSSDEFTNRTFHSGALTLAISEWWAVTFCGDQYNQRLPPQLRERAEAELMQYRELGPRAVELLPLENVPWLRLIPSIWQEVLDHVEDPSYFAANDIRSKLSDISIPIYHLGGWFDPFLRNTIDHYKGASEATANQRLIVGPWTHAGMSLNVAGDAHFPDAVFDDLGYALAWHDRWLRGGSGHAAQQHPVIVYVMGANRWRAEDAWPLPGTRMTDYYLREHGLLSTEPPLDEPPDRYEYDPHRPIPTPGPVPGPGRVVVTELLQRDDVVVYSTPPLEAPVEVTGEIIATLFADSSVMDTDWMLRLVDIQPDGQAYHVVDGVIRARYRRSRTEPTPLVPGHVERYQINLWATSLVFDRGHRIGVVISSSNFPKYDRHPNVYADLRKTTDRDFVTATQTMHHSAPFPSAIHLPVINVAEHQRWIANPMPYTPADTSLPAPRELDAAALGVLTTGGPEARRQ